MATPNRTGLTRWLAGFRPRPLPYSHADYLRAGLGAAAGLIAAYYCARLVGVGPSAVPYIVAPMGATAVLLFAASSSPLAQPWPVLGGNVISAGVGVTAGRAITNPALAAAIAVAAAIVVMMALHCLHPPGGACALFTAVAAPAVHDQGYAFLVTPIAVNTVGLLVIALIVNNASGRPYPHVPPAAGPAAGEGARGVQSADIENAMTRLHQGLDVLPGDVLALIRDAEAYALDRQVGRLPVASVMTPDVMTVLPHENVYRIRMIMGNHRVKAVPVIDDDRRVVGIVTIFDLFRLDLVNMDPASKIMTSPVRTINIAAPVSELVALMTDHGLRHIPVVSDDHQLRGIVTRTELIAVLNRALLTSAAPAEP